MSLRDIYWLSAFEGSNPSPRILLCKMVTKSAGGIVVNSGKVIVVLQYGKVWTFPKGHVKEGETKLQTAKREIFEEAGLTKIEYVRDLGHYTRPRIDQPAKTKTIYMYLFTTKQTDLRPRDSKINEARFVDKSKIVDILTAEKDKEFFKKLLKENLI